MAQAAESPVKLDTSDVDPRVGQEVVFAEMWDPCNATDIRRIVAEQHELPFIKKEAMKVAGKVLAEPKLYRVAIKAADTAVAKLPRAFIYNPFNAWGKQREVPDAPEHSAAGVRSCLLPIRHACYGSEHSKLSRFGARISPAAGSSCPALGGASAIHTRNCRDGAYAQNRSTASSYCRLLPGRDRMSVEREGDFCVGGSGL